MKFLYVDTETTGFDPKNCAIIQIAGCIRTSDKKTENFDIKMAPHDGAVISADALKCNGYTEEQIKKFPPHTVGYKQFVGMLINYVDRFDASDKFFMIGYNVGFDSGFIRELFQRNGDGYFGSYFWNPPIDVMQIAAARCMKDRAEMKNFKLETVASWFGIKPPEGAKMHDAFTDICVTRDLFAKVAPGFVFDTAENVK